MELKRLIKARKLWINKLLTRGRSDRTSSIMLVSGTVDSDSSLDRVRSKTLTEEIVTFVLGVKY